MIERINPSRRTVLAGAGASSLVGFDAPAHAAIGALETKKIRFGLPVPGSSFMPIYIAAEKTWKENGLDVEMVSFRGDAEVAQALAGGSIDVTCQSLDGLLNLQAAEQPIVGFYAGFHQADFVWAAQSAIKSWKDVKGKLFGVSTFGSLTDELTRYVLTKNGLDPAKDVKIIQSGPASGRLQALKSGRLDCAILPPPDKWMAQEAGLVILATQRDDVAAEWPKHAFLATKTFIDRNPNTIKALLRAHVGAIRFARANPDEASKILIRHLKIADKYGMMAYRDVIDGYNERGELPTRSMNVFWKIMIDGGTVKAAVPDATLIDERFMRSFDDWAT